LADGPHTFYVKATGAAGSSDPTPATRTWTVDTIAPTVSSFSPADRAQNVAVSTNAQTTFSEEMDKASVEAGDTFTLTEQGASSPVGATVGLGTDGKTATLNPGADLKAGTSYTARVTTVAKDKAGNALAQDHSWTFTTASAPSPTCTKTGTANAETISGTAGADVICAGGGNDTIRGLGGNDILKGEAGNDTASYSASLTAVTASLATNSATGEGSDTFSGVEKLLGSSKADTLTGSAANNTLTGGGGNDRVAGGGGADTRKGGGGADTIDSKDGVSGNDSLDGGAGTDTKVTDATEKSIEGFP
jgi:Ca2+-binding RTX toxin-like protein